MITVIHSRIKHKLHQSSSVVAILLIKTQGFSSVMPATNTARLPPEDASFSMANQFQSSKFNDPRLWSVLFDGFGRRRTYSEHESHDYSGWLTTFDGYHHPVGCNSSYIIPLFSHHTAPIKPKQQQQQQQQHRPHRYDWRIAPPSDLWGIVMMAEWMSPRKSY